jgi:Fe2+ transport system protein FeoA
MVRRAPLGEPIEITVRGSHIAMRDHEAQHIGITHVEQAFNPAQSTTTQA